MTPSKQDLVNAPYTSDIETPRYYSDMYGQLVMNNHYANIPQHQINSVRTVYLGNLPNDIPISDIMDHVKTGPIQAIRLLLDKNGIFITFLDAASANQFYHEAQQSRLTIQGNELKIGWGKSSHTSTALQEALQMGATRNVFLGSLDKSVTEEELRKDLSRFGHIEHVKIVSEKRIAFVHFLCISNAVKCVNTLPTESKWQSKRVNYGKDRCNRQRQKLYFLPTNSYPSSSSSSQSPTTNSSSDTYNQASVAYAPPVSYDLFTSVPIIYHNNYYNNIANRTIYLGNIHPDTTTEDICNVIRGGILSQIRFLSDKHIAFLTFVDPNVASIIYQQASHQCIMIKSRRIKVGWGKPSALPLNVVRAVQSGGSRNIYIGNIDDTITEEKLKHDFSEYGDIELVNTLKEKNCAFVNFTSIVSAIRALEEIRTKEEYKKFRMNYGKDRCGNPPRMHQQHSKHMYGENIVLEGEEHQPSEPYTIATNPAYSNSIETNANTIEEV